jgi:hypothetical protein
MLIESNTVYAENRAEGSNPSLTDEGKRPQSPKSLTRIRFWRQAKVASADECWNWQGFIDRDGYGRFRVGSKKHTTHRFAFFLANGHGLDAPVIRHKCDNPRCVNPAHLCTGTHQENMRDRSERNRTARGTKNGRAKLTEETVLAIRAAYIPNKITAPMLARQFGINFYVVQDIIRKRTWKHIVPNGLSAFLHRESAEIGGQYEQ